MKEVARILGTLALGLLATAMVGMGTQIYVGTAEEGAWIVAEETEQIAGLVAYQGPVFDDADPNWKGETTYRGVRIADLLASFAPFDPDDLVSVIALDGYAKTFPASVLDGTSPAGDPILALDNGDPKWNDAPMLVFVAPDGQFSNDDMLASLGAEHAHYFTDKPSTTGLMVKGVTFVIVNYDGSTRPSLDDVPDEEEAATEEGSITVVRGDWTKTYSRTELEGLDTITADGTYTTSTDVDRTATYTGVPVATIIGNVDVGTVVRVTASDGYSMNYDAGMFLDRSEGTWILAYMEDGEVMPLDPGYFRIVQVGEDVPHFSSSLSARMVERIEVLGAYEDYTLLLTGAVDRVFERGALEAGIGCPCHTATISATRKGETHSYTGIPLWRLVGWVDDSVFPAAELGIHYNDEDFSDAAASQAYTITLVAADGYTQTVTSDLIARDDRFIVAFKADGVFLDPASSGYMRFVVDDSVELPEGVTLKSVKFLAEIRLDLP